MVTPKAVPLAGGCSTSRATIRQMEMPTASENTIIEDRVEVCEIKAHNEPESKPTR